VITYTKLRSGEWALRGPELTQRDMEGRAVVVHKKNGSVNSLFHKR
jgi:hypothetical protein